MNKTNVDLSEKCLPEEIGKKSDVTINLLHDGKKDEINKKRKLLTTFFVKAEKIKQAEKELLDLLLEEAVEEDKAKDYVNNYLGIFLHEGSWSQESIDDLFLITNRSNITDLQDEIANTMKKYVLNFAERVSLELENDNSELSEQEIKERQEDLLALEEMKAQCGGDEVCKVTDEHKALYTLLSNGIKLNGTYNKPTVTIEEIEDFRDLGKKFGLPEFVIKGYIEKKLEGTLELHIKNILSEESNNKSKIGNIDMGIWQKIYFITGKIK